MALQASGESSRAHRRDLEKELREWADWLSDPAKAPAGKLHRLTKPPPRFEDEFMLGECKATSPLEIDGARTKVFEGVWAADTVNRTDTVA
eukprot:7698776-Pyramimonas_sp.AAC.1